MKRSILFGAIASLAMPVFAADSTLRDDIISAAKKLGEKQNYSWKTTSVVPEDAQFRRGPIEGKTDKNGLTLVFDNATQAALKGDKAAFTWTDGKWESLTDYDDSKGPGRAIPGIVHHLETPAAQAADLAVFAKELKKDGDVYSGDLTDEGAKRFLTFSRFRVSSRVSPRQIVVGPTVNSAKGSVKFWVKDGVLTKYEYKVKGTANFYGNDRDIDRATNVEIKDVGTTKMNVPEEAKKLL
jgi:hypothetical protein